MRLISLKIALSKVRLPWLRLAPALMAALIVAIAFSISACGAESSETPGRPVKLARTPDSFKKHQDIVNAALRRATIYEPAFDLFGQLEQGQVLGTFEVPQIGIKDYLVEGTDPEELAKGSGHIEGSALPGLGGNFSIAADRVLYSAPLLRADLLQVGDQIFVNMPYARFVYRIESLTVVIPEDISVIQPVGYEAITFATCEPMWQISNRIIVHAKMTESESKI